MVSGEASVRAAEWHVRDLLIRLGGTTLNADVARVAVAGKPLMKIKLGAEQIDVKELETLIPKSQMKDNAPEKPMLDIPLLKASICRMRTSTSR